MPTMEELMDMLPAKKGNALLKKYNELPDNEKDSFHKKTTDVVRKYTSKDKDNIKRMNTESAYIEKAGENPRAKNADPMALQNYANSSASIKNKLRPSTFKKNTPYGNKKVGTHEGRDVYKNSKGQNYYFTGDGGATIIKGGTFKKIGDKKEPTEVVIETDVVEGTTTPPTPPVVPAADEVITKSPYMDAEELSKEYDDMTKKGYSYDNENRKWIKNNSFFEDFKINWGKGIFKK